MICKMIRDYDGKTKGCGGAGTIWYKNVLIDCTRCGGRGESFKHRNIPTYLKPKEP